MPDFDVQELQLRTDNPYSIGSIFQFDEGDVLLDREPLKVEKSSKDRYYTTIEGDTLTNIAAKKKAYGNSKLWWIIADVNNIDWPFEVPIGTTLLIPDINKINLT